MIEYLACAIRKTMSMMEEKNQTSERCPYKPMFFRKISTEFGSNHVVYIVMVLTAKTMKVMPINTIKKLYK